MKYIGIRGHRGAGKSTIAYLLANTLEYLTNDHSYDDYEKYFNIWCDDIIADEGVTQRLNCQHVIIEGFGDTPKMLLFMLTGIPMHEMNSDYYKDHIIINLKDFSKKVIDDPIEYNEYDLITADEYFKHVILTEDPQPIKNNVWMTLRELILYFGIYVMQNAFGLNVWIKSLQANKEYFNGLFHDDQSGYKIFCDIKARSEISYIKEHDGIIIKVSRPDHKKNGGMNLLKGDSRYDYEITNCDNLKSIANQIWEIAKKIKES